MTPTFLSPAARLGFALVAVVEFYGVGLFGSRLASVASGDLAFALSALGAFALAGSVGLVLSLRGRY